ncbi:MAG: hypothetical protein AVDCRST_MAG68-358, partial [uncultured Gemmatimonadetes bacterium]
CGNIPLIRIPVQTSPPEPMTQERAAGSQGTQASGRGGWGRSFATPEHRAALQEGFAARRVAAGSRPSSSQATCTFPASPIPAGACSRWRMPGPGDWLFRRINS